jgi:hypothetical protein
MNASQIGPVDRTFVPLPRAERVRADVQRMVDVGVDRRMSGWSTWASTVA